MKTAQEMVSEMHDAGLNDGQIAALVFITPDENIAQSQIHRIRSGERKSPQVRTWAAINAAYEGWRKSRRRAA